MKVSGCTYLRTGKCDMDGARYWPIVSMSMLCARMSRMTCKISSSVSPRPTMMPLFVGTLGCSALNFFSRFKLNW